MDSLSDPEKLMPDLTRQERIRGAIDAYNAGRPGIMRNCHTMATLCMLAYAGISTLILAAFWNIDEKHKLLAIVAAFLFFGGYKLWEWVTKPIRDHQLTLRYRLFPEIFAFIDGVAYSHGHEPGFLRDIDAMKMVRFSSTENDDIISGTHDGLFFELVETKLVLGSGKNRTTMFQGLIFHFKLDQPFPGLIYAARRGNWLQQWVGEMFGTDVDLVASGDHDLDATYDFHTTNYSAGRKIVEGPLAKALHYLRREWYEGDVRIALKDDECFLLLPSKQDYFALPDIHTDVTYDDVKPMIREMAVLLAVAHLMRKVGMAEGKQPDEEISTSEGAETSGR